MGIRSSGLVSGLDTNAIIQALVDAERIPITKLQQQRADFSAQLSKVGQISSAIDSFDQTAKDLESLSDVLAYTATSSDDDIFTASATGEAVAGSYNVLVSALASPEKDRSAAFTAETAEVKEGTLTISVPGEDDVVVTINAGDTLSDVAYSINASDAKVSAGLIFDGADYYLSMTATDSGFEIDGDPNAALVLTESYTGATGGELTLAQVQTATNAQLQVDGLAIERRSNTIGDVITGVTLELTDTDAAQKTLTVSTDAESVVENLQKFVSSYNSLISMLEGEMNVDEDTDRNRSLVGDPLVRTLKMQLSSAVGEQVSITGSGPPNLGAIGITTSAKGTLSLDDADLREVLASDPQGVAALFTNTTDGISKRVQDLAEDYLDFVDGRIKNRQKGLNDSIAGIDTQIERLEMRAAEYESQLVQRFTALEQTLSGLKAQENYLYAYIGG